jgi:hypothetical protein
MRRRKVSAQPDRPPLTVVVASLGPQAALESCLAALEPQVDGAEVLVCDGHRNTSELSRRFQWARFEDMPTQLVPELWRDGIELASGRIVALTISAMIPEADWIESIKAVHAEHDVVGGAIEPAAGLRVADWAEYFCRYVRDMRPFEGHECVEHLPGDNAAYKRELLERTRELYQDGFWEPVIHRRLAEEGVVVWHSPELVVRQGRSAGVRAFVRQRLVHGRAHGRTRGVHFSRLRNLAGVLGAALVPPLLTLRIFREVTAKRRYRMRLVAALPLLLAYNVAWAAGEALGHVDALRGSPS